ncbi:hypothetical protein FIU87_16365 [Bacillus sp. THAF10]|uniref:hypothetical protein n=1 Tax=Bacillus sp. THAF10 TaxID=2587848 RepID=UPI0012690892|nr:hypothetical protein [Bacillus sp. THAF10]QFT90239.1 hypothetical protein FIU87_16365 [Bacillus sp. THAF10]
MNLGRVFIFIISLSVMVGCSVSEEEALEKSKETFEQVFQGETVEATEDTEMFTYHLPEKFEVESASNNNVVLLHKEQHYLLFVNPMEAKDSDVVYESTKSNYSELQLDHTFSHNGRLGYVLVAPLEEEENMKHEVTVGIGGVKMTTVTETNNLENSTKYMMEIVSSVKVKDQQ